MKKCKHNGLKKLIVIEAFAEHEVVKTQCCLCNKMLVFLPKPSFIKRVKKRVLKILKK